MGPLVSLKLKILEVSGIFDGGAKKNQKEIVREIPVVVPCAVNLAANGGGYAELLAQFAHQRFGVRFSPFHFSSGEFPLECMRVVALALANQQLRIPGDQSCDDSGHKMGTEFLVAQASARALFAM